jgi:glycosyltransferase involved in cell wall biosynthesis
VVSPPHRERIHKLVLGVDGEVFRRRGPYPGGRTVVAVGRLVEKKGFAHLIDAAALLKERDSVGRIVICGNGELRSSLLERIERQGVAGLVELVEAWGAEPVRELLEASDLFAMPCVIAEDGDRDSMPVVVKEALAMEIPVVGSDEVGMPEMVSPEWGRLVPPADAKALAAAIEEMLSLSPEERAAMGARGRVFVLEHCDLARETAKLAELIAGAGDGSRP